MIIRKNIKYYTPKVAILLAFKFFTGANKTLPVPRYTFTKPSAEIAEPIRLFVDFSTVKFKLSDYAIAKFPSTFRTSF